MKDLAVRKCFAVDRSGCQEHAFDIDQVSDLQRVVDRADGVRVTGMSNGLFTLHGRSNWPCDHLKQATISSLPMSNPKLICATSFAFEISWSTSTDLTFTRLYALLLTMRMTSNVLVPQGKHQFRGILFFLHPHT